MGVSVEARGLCKSIKGKKVVDHVQFYLKPGQCLGVVGQSLSGKTVLFRMLSGQWIPDSGEVFINEISTKTNQGKIKRLVGYQPQQEGFEEDLTVLDNLTVFSAYFNLFGTKSVLRARETLRGVELEHMDEDVVRHLAPWQRRRLALARAVLTKPEVLILDHPTEGLDREQQSWIVRWIRARMKEGITVVISTNHLEEAELLCQEILFMEKGKVICHGEPQRLIEAHVGREVLECHVDPQDLEYHLRAIHGQYSYQVLKNQIRIFLPQPAQGLDAARMIGGGEQIHIRRAGLGDVYAKLTGRDLEV